MTLRAEAVAAPAIVPPVDGHPSRWRWYLAAALAALCVAQMVQRHDLTYLTVTSAAAVIAWMGVSLRPRRQRLAWSCVAAAVSVNAVAEILFFVVTRVDGEAPDISVADPFYLAAYLGIGAGLLILLVERDSQRRIDVDNLIDMGSYGILSLIVVSQVADVGEIFADTESPLIARLAWAAYPMLDAMLLAVLVRALVSRRMSGWAGILMALGISGWLVADFVTLLVADPTFLSAWLDVCWMIGASAMALATWPGAGAWTTEPVDTLAPVTGARVLIGLAPLALPGIIATTAFVQGESINPIPLTVASIALILLAYVRATRLVRLRDRQQADLESGRRYYHALADNSADAVVVVDADDLMVNDNPHLSRMLGAPALLAAGTNVITMLDPVDRDRARAALVRMRAAPGVLLSELRMRHSDGSDRWFAARSVDLVQDPAIRGLVINLHEVTDRKHAEDQLTHRAFHDSLTGLANRALFRDRVDHALQRTARTGSDIAVVYLDLDGFKTVNDSRGHESGDDVLREIAHRLQAAVRTADTVARLGGDEFAILIEQSARPLDEAGTVADRILQSLTTPIQLTDQQIVLSASIGITISDPDSTASSMLRDADIAMYRAKSTGKGKWTVYDPQMRAAAIERLQLQTDLITALANREFRLVYQPIIELETESIVGFEALLRWEHPTRGIIQPDAFIGLTEESGAIVDIGAWVLTQACHTAATWQALQPARPLTMAVNLSPRQIATADIIDHVTTALAASGFPPEQLILELTESVLVEDAPTAAQRLHELHELHVRLAIDDFGTGYSSLSYLRQFPVDILKIDRSFTNTITHTDTIPAIIRGLLDLGKTLQLETVAEGIEHTVQRDSLRDQHCDYGQGFLFAKPLTEHQVVALLTKSPRPRDQPSTPV